MEKRGYEAYLERKRQQEERKNKNVQQEVNDENNIQEVQENIEKENVEYIANDVKNISENNVGTEVELKIEKLEPYTYEGKQQPFNDYSEEEMEQLKNSIEINGLHEPIIVRKIEGTENYQIIAGHNRTRAFKELGRNRIPARIIECDDDKARLIMIETNVVKRNNLSNMERARAYKIQQDIYSKEKYSGNKNSVVNSILENYKTGKTSYYRYIRLNYLIDEFQKLIETPNKEIKINIRQAEIISYLDEEKQKILLELLKNKEIKLNEKKLVNLKNKSSEKESISKEEIIECFKESSKENTGIIIKFNSDEVEKYFLNDTDKADIKELIIKALDKYFAGEK